MATNNLALYLSEQIGVCAKYCLPECDTENMIAIALSTLGKMPIYGTRVEPETKGNITWFIYCGEYSENENFYQPLCTNHLCEILPQVVKYLRLPIGVHFILDDQGYEDVWMEVGENP